MADFTDRVKLVFEAVTSGATSDMSKLEGATDKAQSGFGKLKDAAGGAVSSIMASPAAAVAAGAVIAKVAFDLVTGFEEAALSAQNFATASGLSVEQASRWQEVAGDVGVSTETLAGAVNKMDIAAGKGVLAKLGIGGADVNEQLTNALTHLQGIHDAGQRAVEGAAIFGKSWANLAPLVEQAGDLKANLAAVSDQRVIDPGEVAKAEAFRDAMDRLSDTMDQIKLAIGGELIGMFSDFADTLGNITDAAQSVGDTLGPVADVVGSAFDLVNPVAQLGNLASGLKQATDFGSGWQNQLGGLERATLGNIPVIGGFADSLFGANDAADEAKASAQSAAGAVAVHAQAMKDAAAAADEEEKNLNALTTATLASFNSTLGLAAAGDKTTEAFGKYATAADAAEQSSWGNKTANDAAAVAQREAEQAALAQAAAQAKLATDQATANGATLTAAQSNAVLADSLRTTAGTLAADSPLRRSLLAYANQIEAVPDTASTTFVADTESASQKVDALANKIYGLVGQIFHIKVQADTPAVASSSAAPSTSTALATTSATVVPFATPAPRAGAPSTVINLSVGVAPFTNPAEVGRAIADYLDAFYRRNGTRARAVA